MSSGLLCTFFVGVLALGLTTAGLGQEPPPPPASQGSSQDNSSTQGQAQEPPKEESAGTAAKKAKTKKGKLEPGKVYSEDDLQRLPDGGLSIIGQKPAPKDDAAKANGADGKTEAGKGDSTRNGKADEPEEKDEFYWRKRAQKILEPLEALNEEIERARDEAKRPKPSRPDSDPNDPSSANAEVADDSKSRLVELEKQKAELEK
ncbi:MAG: hypothetical protein ACRD36_03070, partial [Candidatus Acidiferrum sp.]